MNLGLDIRVSRSRRRDVRTAQSRIEGLSPSVAKLAAGIQSNRRFWSLVDFDVPCREIEYAVNWLCRKEKGAPVCCAPFDRVFRLNAASGLRLWK